MFIDRDHLMVDRLRQAIVRSPVTVASNITVQAAIACIGGVCGHPHSDAAASCVVVVDGDRVVGILTARDIVRLSAHRYPLDQVPIQQVMTQPVITLRESEVMDLLTPLQLLEQHQIRHLPVVDDRDRLVGLITDQSCRRALNPLELCQRTDILENRVKQLEHETSQRLQEAQRIAHLGNWNLNLQDNTLYWSDEIFRIFEINPQQFGASYEAFLQAIHPDDRDLVNAAYTQHLHDHQPYKICHRLLLPDGRIKYVQEQCETLYADDGTPILSQGTVQDITELKQAELALEQLNAELEARVAQRTAELQEREARYRALMDGASDAILLTNLHGNLLEANDKAEELLGYTRSELTTMHFTQLHCPDTLPDIIAAFERVKNHESSQALNITFRCKDGSIIPVDMTASVLEINGEMIVQGIFRDIRDRQRNEAKRQAAELALQQSEAKYRQIFELANEGIWAIDASANTLFCNQALTNMLGTSLEEMVGTSLFDFVTAEVRPLLHDHLQQWQAGIQEQYELPLSRKDGALLFALVSASPLVNESGQFLGSIAMLTNITDRKQSENALRESEERSRQLAERETLLREITQRIRQSLDLQVIFDTACQEVRQVLHADRVGIFKFDVASGYTGGEFVAESVVDGFSSVLAVHVHDHCFGEDYAPLYSQGRYAVMPDIYALEECHTNVLTQFQVKANLVMPLICGEVLWGLLCIHQCTRPRHWQQSDIDLGHQLTNQLAIAIQQVRLVEQLQQELKERQQAQQQLTERNQELARATRLKDEFLANMSHELRTPLNAILGMTEGLQEGVFGPINDQQTESLHTIETSAVHLLSLINDILDVAKIESGQIELECTSIPVAPLCSSSLAFIKQQALKKSIQIKTHLPANLPNLLVDERRTRQALINLLTNAVKFTPEGGRITLTVSLQSGTPIAQPQFLRIAIADTGIGIAPDNLEKLFRPFVQIDSTLSRQYSGTGLGLSLVKQIAELHGGQVALTSELGVGSCFTIDLPCDPNAPITVPREPLLVPREPIIPPQLEPDHATPSPLILLAEDNEANINTVSGYLKAKGYRLSLAKTGLEAIDIAQADHPDLILMDIQMPGMDGLEAMQHIRRLPGLHNVPIIALTALTMAGDRDRCLAAGANEYLAKPVKLRQLVATIQQFLHHPEPTL